MTVSRAEPSSSPSSSSSSSSSSLLDGHLLSSTAFFSPDGLVMSDARLPVVAQLGGELDHPTVRFSSAATSLALLPLRCIFLSAGMTDWCNACLLRLALLTLSSPIDCPPPRRTSFAACLCWLRLLLWVRNTNHRNKKEKKKQPEGNKNSKLAIYRRRCPLLSCPVLSYLYKKRETSAFGYLTFFFFSSPSPTKIFFSLLSSSTSLHLQLYPPLHPPLRRLQLLDSGLSGGLKLLCCRTGSAPPFCPSPPLASCAALLLALLPITTTPPSPGPAPAPPRTTERARGWTPASPHEEDMAEFGGVNAHAHADLLRQAMLQNVIRTTENSEERKEEEEEEEDEDEDNDNKVERDYGGKEKASTSSCRPALISASRQELRCKARDRFISAWGEGRDGKTPPSCHPSFLFSMPRQ
ncbi:uncharacterized protein ARB_05436 [Trichophyton benhamiae CBS 112371]|uniref:Uncharacterized protein n=1 Tax=Arthroderma benhamiae (strain ATCC MYA-4681 / CBS 112371) TaxID=663331 RepID=D4AMI3_ARTBC|nr:uncharacterized protein ARB_05436 [Trichophyton benhamiae CBS 112371]EFE35394.1 hypothetical protein ARB_05436 [Trichophyton benhamiae CBS 112371]